MAKGKIKRTVQGIKTCIWLNKDVVVDILQIAGPYILVLYNDYQIFIPEDAIEVITYAI